MEINMGDAMNRATEPMDIAEYVNGPRSKANKYGVSDSASRTFDGKVYDSKAEMLRAQELWREVGCGVLIEVVEQPRVWLGVRENVYVPDFLVQRGDKHAHYEDVKGLETPAFKKNKKLWAKYGRLPLHILTRQRGGGWNTEIIEPLTKS